MNKHRYTRLAPFKTRRAMEDWLAFGGIPYKTAWRDQLTRTSIDLFREQKSGISGLAEEDGRPVRIVYSVVIDVVCYLNESLILHLQEIDRRTRSGKVQRRHALHSISGKIFPKDAYNHRKCIRAARACVAQKLSQLQLPARTPEAKLVVKDGIDPIIAARDLIRTDDRIAKNGAVILLGHYQVRDFEPYPYPGLPTRRDHCSLLFIVPPRVHADSHGQDVSFTSQHKKTVCRWYPYKPGQLNNIFVRMD